MKKTWTVLLALVMMIPLNGCSGAKKGKDEFAQYTKTIPALLCQGSSMDINFLFDHPEDYGIKSDVYSLDYMSLKDYKKLNEALDEKVEELDDFDYDSLSKDQKITYDLIAYQESQEDEIPVENSYYLTTNYFDINSGIQASLPMSLWNYEFKNKKSVDSFLAILKDAPTYFKKYIALEKTRQEKGYGMSKTYMEDVLSSFHTINTTDQTYILESAKEKINAISFLDEQAKTDIIQKIQTAFEESFLPAFVDCEKDLTNVEILKKGEGELSSYKYGKEYYEELVTSAAAVDSIKDYKKYLDEQEDIISKRIFPMVENYPELATLFSDEESFSKAMSEMHLTDLTTTQEVIEFLEEKISTGKDLPKINKLEYKMNLIPDSMKETISASAAYYLSAFDDTSGKDEQMILNGSFDQSSFTTIAHESFPGHMYQHNYFKTVKHDIVRDLLSNGTYSEGWATYVEDKSCDYSDAPGLCHFEKLNSQLTYLYVLNLDYQIHYEGISREKAYQFMKDNFGFEDEEALSDQYEQLLELPAVFANYHVGNYKLLDLKDKAKEKWGDKYSDLRFNKLILDLGPLPMELLEKYANL